MATPALLLYTRSLEAGGDISYVTVSAGIKSHVTASNGSTSIARWSDPGLMNQQDLVEGCRLMLTAGKVTSPRNRLVAALTLFV
jgi:hypothetical protein